MSVKGNSKPAIRSSSSSKSGDIKSQNEPTDTGGWRATQMSSQQEWLLSKKAEIEKKLNQKQEENDKEKELAIRKSSTEKKSLGLKGKNRWGFKGKGKSHVQPKQSIASSQEATKAIESTRQPQGNVSGNVASDSDISFSVLQALASLVAVNGDEAELKIMEKNKTMDFRFLQNHESNTYRTYRQMVTRLREGFAPKKPKAARKSRWDQPDETVPTEKISTEIKANRSPQLVEYAIRVFGTTNLEDHQWRQCEDQLKLSLVYNDINQVINRNSGKRKYEYDSDEDTEGGTWEHKARTAEMERTLAKDSSNEGETGKHHIGDFLPPEELAKFIQKYDAIQNGSEWHESDYAENQLTETNQGFIMLQKMGWTEGAGLGSSNQGIKEPVNKSNMASEKSGLGTQKPHDLEEADTEFDAYRKRMMMAYRFRPNPLNNPRRSYY